LPPGHSLTGADSKARGRVTQLAGGHELHARLAGMGIIPGVTIEVVRNDGRGPMVIAVNRTRIVLGRGMAEKVLIV